MTPLDANFYSTITPGIPFYYDAFLASESQVWQNTDFAKDLMDICYNRALACWTRGRDEGEEDRRLLLRSYLKPSFGVEEQNDVLNTMFPILPSDNSYIIRTLKNLCYIYNTAPTRTYEGLDEKTTYSINELLGKIKFNKAMQIGYRLAKLCNEVMMRPVRRNGKLKIEILTPDNYRVKKDMSGAIKELWIPFVEGTDQKFHVWTDNVYRVAKSDGKFTNFSYNNGKSIIAGGSQGITNIYGQIPYAMLELDDAYTYSTALFELVKAQLYANKLELLADENVTFNGFSVWVGTNLQNMKDHEKLRISPRHLFDIRSAVSNDSDPIPPSLESVSPSPHFDMIHLFKIDKMKSVLKNLGLPVSMIEEQTGTTSGIGILRERQELTDAQEEDKEVLMEYEDTLINLLLSVENIENNGKYPQQVSVKLNYADVKVLEEPDKQFETERLKFEYGVITPREFLGKFTDQDFETEEEAIQFINDNRNYLETLGSTNEQTNNTDIAGKSNTTGYEYAVPAIETTSQNQGVGGTIEGSNTAKSDFSK